MTTPPEVPTQEAARRQFRVHWASGVFAFVFLARGALAAVRGNHPSTLSHHLGGVVGGIFLALLFGWLAYLIARRSNLIGNAVFCLMLGMSNLSSAARTRSQVEPAAVRQMDEKFRNQAREALDALDSPGGIAPDPDAAVRTINTLEEAAGASSGFQKDSLECMAEVVRSHERLMADYNAAMAELNDSGAADVSGITDRSSIQQRLSTVTRFNESNEAWAEHMRRSEGIFRRCLISRHVAPSLVEDGSHAFRREARMTEVLQLRDIDRKLAAAITAYLTLLDKYWGTWKYNAESGIVLFDSDAILSESNAIVERINQASAEREELRRKVLQEVANPGKSP